MGLFTKKKAETSPQQQVIDIRADEPTKPRWGSPVPCPSCSGRGYLDHIDPYREIMFMHCTECFAKYDLARADMDLDETTEAFTI
jgi:hypothetical protein